MNVIKRNLNLNKMTKIIQIYKKKNLNGLNGLNHLNKEELRDENLNLVIKKKQQLNLKKELNQESIKLANELLKNGKIIAIPTDTIYGIACSIHNNESLNKLQEIKKRDLNLKAYAICVNNLEDIYKWSKVTVDKQILNELLPGPITVVFERNKLLNPNLNSSFNLIGIRIPNDNFVNSLTHLNNPLVLTSANLSSEPSAGSIDEFKKIWSNLDAIFDGGKLDSRSDPFKLGSTVVDLSKPNKFRIIRKGCSIDKVISILQDKYSFEEI